MYYAIGSQVFAGGFALGVSRHFNILKFFEWDKYGNATLAHNFPTTPIDVGERNWHTHGAVGVDLVFGNPPCAAWSQNNPAAGNWRSSPYLARTRAHVKLAFDLNAKAWITESVPGAWKNGKPFFLELAEEFLAHNYMVSFVLHDAKYLGLPQKRPRFFMVAHRHVIPWARFIPDLETTRIPDAATIVAMVEGTDNQPVGRPIHEETLAAHYDELKPGQRLRDLFDALYPDPPRKPNGHVKGRPSFCEYRLPLTGPANTMSGSYTIIHPTKNRPLYLREIKALCGYPMSYRFIEGGKIDPPNTGLLSQLARAVLPPVGEWIAKCVKAGLDNGIPATPSMNLIDFRKDPVVYQTNWQPESLVRQPAGQG